MSKAAGTSEAPGGQADDICPVCKSSRYLNPNMRFLINPECYHRMCESCVDRIFSTGPAPCPVAGCARTLRKQRFRKQTFEDLQVERYVDVRRRVAAVFNLQEEDFSSLRAYNDYLEEMENITFNLTNNIDVEATETKLAAYAAQIASEAAPAAAQASQDSPHIDSQLAAKMEQAQLRREGANQDDADEKDGPKVVLKKSTARRNAATKAQSQPTSKVADNGTAAAATSYVFQGLKPKVAPEPQKPYDPFGGLSLKWEYHSPQTDYKHPWLDKARTDPLITTGGYNAREYCARAMLEAFEGLGVFVEDEIEERDAKSGEGGGGDVGTGAGTASTAAAAAKRKGEMVVLDDDDDIF